MSPTRRLARRVHGPLRIRLPRPTAAPAFRSRLRDEFVRGVVAPPSGRRARTWRRLARWLPAAAAAVLAVLVASNAGEAPRVVRTTGDGDVRVDGRPEPALRGGAPARPLRPGARLHVPAGTELDLEWPGIARLQVPGGTELTIPRGPGRWFGRSCEIALEAGELRLTTLRRFEPARIAVRTPEARAIVTGTTLAVMRLADATCVCVLEGRVGMAAGGSTAIVHPGTRRSVFRDGRAPLVEPILPMEEMKLGMLRDHSAPEATR